MIINPYIFDSVKDFRYNFFAANDDNFAPALWRLPTDIEIGASIGSTGLLIKEPGTATWNTDNGTNEKNFSAKGGGLRNDSGVFSGLKEVFRYWSEEFDVNNAYSGSLSDAGVNTFTISTPKEYGCSVRLIYEGGGTPAATLVDFDGNIYDVIEINGYYWTKQDWKCTKLNNGVLIPNVTDNTDWSNLSTKGRCTYNNV